jgi:hypothetical protein
MLDPRGRRFFEATFGFHELSEHPFGLVVELCPALVERLARIAHGGLSFAELLSQLDGAGIRRRWRFDHARPVIAARAVASVTAVSLRAAAAVTIAAAAARALAIVGGGVLSRAFARGGRAPDGGIARARRAVGHTGTPAAGVAAGRTAVGGVGSGVLGLRLILRWLLLRIAFAGRSALAAAASATASSFLLVWHGRRVARLEAGGWRLEAGGWRLEAGTMAADGNG